MDALRITLIILGVIVIALIYFWERHKNKVNLDKQVVNLPEEDDEPGVMISIRKDTELDLSTDLADLREFMNERDMPESEVDMDSGRIASVADEDDSSEQNVEPESREISEQEIITLHIIARDGEMISGKDLQKSAESNGLIFSDMNIFHFPNTKNSESPGSLFSLVNMYEPGVFEPDKMNEFRTRGVSLFAFKGQDINALEVFDTMLDTAKKLADELDAILCGPERQPLDKNIINRIRLSLDRNG